MGGIKISGALSSMQRLMNASLVSTTVMTMQLVQTILEASHAHVMWVSLEMVQIAV